MDLAGYLGIALALILIITLFVYLFRKRLFKPTVQKKSIQSFKTELKIFLKNSFPNITFDYDIFQKVNVEKDSRTRQVLIAEDIALQFATFDFALTTQSSIGNDLLWSTYEYDVTPAKNKAPKNLQKIKEFSFKRDNKSCVRCGRSLRMEHAQLGFVKSIQDGGTYHFENVMTLCVDCNRVLNANNTKTIANDLPLLDEILKKADF